MSQAAPLTRPTPARAWRVRVAGPPPRGRRATAGPGRACYPRHPLQVRDLTYQHLFKQIPLFLPGGPAERRHICSEESCCAQCSVVAVARFVVSNFLQVGIDSSTSGDNWATPGHEGGISEVATEKMLASAAYSNYSREQHTRQLYMSTASLVDLLTQGMFLAGWHKQTRVDT